jgi:protein-S-isoprenylcysteine O-methyltransferase Ste14
MNDLNRKALSGLLRFVIILAVFLFLPAWTFRYWQAWIFLSVFSACALATSLYVMKNDPKLLERRMRAGPGAEKERSQQIIQWVAMFAFIAAIVFPPLDHRFTCSTVPSSAVIGGDGLVALGFLIIFLVLRENSFASGVIEVDAGQRVVATGPYALVRHPMYSGALVMLLGVPLALGSRWGLLLVIPITLVIAWRLLDEEAFLAKRLQGYPEYQARVRYRLVPWIW